MRLGETVSERSDLERNPQVRYGFYLRPSFEMSRAQAEIHDLLRRQFGLEVGGKFMPHATVMSFFRSDAPIAGLVKAIDGAMAGRLPFTVWNAGPIQMGSGIVLDVHHDGDGEENEAIQAVHEAALSAILPLVHPGCEFAFGNWSGKRYHAHLTLAMADVPEFAVDEIREFVNGGGMVGPNTFLAEYFHLFAFQSDNWAGAWWETMTWEFLHSWRLKD